MKISKFTDSEMMAILKQNEAWITRLNIRSKKVSVVLLTSLESRRNISFNCDETFEDSQRMLETMIGCVKRNHSVHSGKIDVW
jgi:protein-arginine kinase activator protein McsA